MTNAAVPHTAAIHKAADTVVITVCLSIGLNRGVVFSSDTSTDEIVVVNCALISVVFSGGIIDAFVEAGSSDVETGSVVFSNSIVAASVVVRAFVLAPNVVVVCCGVVSNVELVSASSVVGSIVLLICSAVVVSAVLVSSSVVVEGRGVVVGGPGISGCGTGATVPSCRA